MRITSLRRWLGLVTVAWVIFGNGMPRSGFAASTPISHANDLIQIGVEVVEVDQQKSQDLGVAWNSDISVTEVSVPSVFGVGAFTRSPLAADIHFLLQEGAADMLANPKLVTRDGTAATFHAGGEFPYAVSGSLGTTSVEFKPYGVNLKISPHVNDDKRIVLSMDAEVSGPDDANSVTLSGNTVPGIRSRTVSSQLTMDPGSTLTLAGLIQNQKQWTRIGIPGLMHIPVLGYLFSHKVMKDDRTSIVVFITPTILNDDRALPPAATTTIPKISMAPAAHEKSADRSSESGGVLDSLDRPGSISGSIGGADE